MNTLWKYVIVEWKLMFRGMFIWFLLAAVCGILYMTLQNNYYGGDIGWYTVSNSYLFMSPMFLIAQFCAVAVARRDVVSRTYILQDTLPYHSWQLLSARLIALIIPFGIIALIPACSYVFQAWNSGIAWSSMSEGLRMLGSFIVPMTFTILLAYWIGTWTRNRVVYLVSSAIVLSLIVLARVVLVIFVPVHWVHFADMGLTDFYSFGFYSELWGFNGDSVYWLHRVFYAAIIIFIFSWIVYRSMRNRRENNSKFYCYPLFGAAIVTALVSVFSYASIWNERNESYKQNIAFYREVLTLENPAERNEVVVRNFLAGKEMQTITEEELLERFQAGEEVYMGSDDYFSLTEQHERDLLLGQKYAGLTAQDYDLKVNIADDHVLEVQGNIRLHHGGEEELERFPLSLRHHFNVDEVSVGGMNASFEWEPYQDVLWVIPAKPVQPHADVELTMVYAGAVDDWYYREYYRDVDDWWERRVFVDNDQLFLPGYYGWYPYPGNDRVAELEVDYYDRSFGTVTSEVIKESQPLRLPANFHVLVESDVGMQLVANGDRISGQVDKDRQRITFEATDVRGFNLIGGDITEWKAEQNNTELSITLSNQIPKAKAEPLADQLLTHYTEMAKVAKLLRSDAYFPDKINFIRAEYPASKDLGSYSYTGNLDTTIDRNGYSYLSYFNHPASMIANHWYRLSYFDDQLIEETVLASNVMNNQAFYMSRYLKDAISHYIQHSGNLSDGPLFDPTMYLASNKPDPIYVMMSKIYESTGKEGFSSVLLKMYEHLQSYEGNEMMDADSEFTIFLEKLIGELR